jgi:hypothetical protein
VRQAYSEASGGAELPPLDVIRVLEHTAKNHNPNYEPFNMGTGYVDATAAVRIAEKLGRGELRVADLDTGLDPLVSEKEDQIPVPDPDPVSVSANGSRSDSGDAFTGGQTNRVEITLDSVDVTIPESDEDTKDNNAELASTEARVTESVPEGWTVDPSFGDVESWDDENNVVDFGTVTLDPSSDNGLAGDSVSFTYYAEAPEGESETGSYTFGPATVTVDFQNQFYEENDTIDAEFSGTDTAYVAGPSTKV